MKNAIRFVFAILIFMIFCTSLEHNAEGCTYFGINQKFNVATGNPMLPEPNELFDFKNVTSEKIVIAAGIVDKRAEVVFSGITQLKNTNRTFENTVIAFDDGYNILQKFLSANWILLEASEDQSVRDTARIMSGRFLTRLNELFQNDSLYQAIHDYSETKEAKSLTGERSNFLNKILKQFSINGMKLNVIDREKLKVINKELNSLNMEFDKNTSKSPEKVVFNRTELVGLSEEFLRPFKIKNDSNYAFDLSRPTFSSFLTFCSNENSRKKMYLAYWNVGGYANEVLLARMILLRTKKAQLLGFKTYSEYITSDIMSGKPEVVWKFEHDLEEKLRIKSDQELKNLLLVKTKYTGVPARIIYPYDVQFYTNIILMEKFNVDQEKVKEYFEMNAVLQGVFLIYQKLYDLQFVKDTAASVWQRDVTAYSVFDNKTHAQIGYFYLDLYPRENKYHHVGCFRLVQSKHFLDGSKQLISSAFIGNFPKPIGNKPSLLYHDQVVVFFHEFGHLIHTILSDTEQSLYAGTNVARDFVEAPSQIMENWAWNKEVLSLFAKHYRTGKVIPDSLLNNMIAARNLNSGLINLYKVYYGTLDLTMNDGFTPDSAADILKLSRQLHEKIMPYPWVDGVHIAGSFTHYNVYASVYYTYLWSQVYSADMFSEFERTGILNSATGQRYRECVLAKGGTEDPIRLVSNFLQREPNSDAFLKLNGMQ